MDNRIMNVLRISTLAISALMLAATSVGCVTTEESDLETEAESSDEEASQSTDSEPGAQPQAPICNGHGVLKCPDTGKSWVYTQPTCGLLTYPKAYTLCNNACVSQCTDLGWLP